MQIQLKQWETEGQRSAHRTMVAWITYLRSSSTVFRTSLDSALTSALMGWFRFTRIFFDLKSENLGLKRHTTTLGSRRTRIEVVLVGLVIDENAGLDQGLKHLGEKVLPNVRRRGKFIK